MCSNFSHIQLSTRFDLRPVRTCKRGVSWGMSCRASAKLGQQVAHSDNMVSAISHGLPGNRRVSTRRGAGK
jgi:hypothetical protein